MSASDRNYCDLRWAEAVRSEEYITVHTGQESGQIFDFLLRASPQPDETWSESLKPRERFDHSTVAPTDEYLVRYRVRFTPEATPFPSLTPGSAEEATAE